MDKKWNKEIIKADHVVIAMGGTSDRSLVEDLDGVIQEIYVIGDAKNPRKLYNAIQEGFHVGREI